MGRTIQRTVLLAFCVVAILAQSTLARYNPNQGKWTTRDPVGTAMSPDGNIGDYEGPAIRDPIRSGVHRLRTDRTQLGGDHPPDAITQTAVRPSPFDTPPADTTNIVRHAFHPEAHGPRRAAGSARSNVTALLRFTGLAPLTQYWNGANLYGYASGRPTAASDPTGLDRYIITQWPHYAIGVDVWGWDSQRKCWVVRGQKRFDFSVDYRTDGWEIGMVLFWGLVRQQDGLDGGTKQTLTSACSEDRALLQSMLDQVANPPAFSLPLYNCYHWTMEHIGDGMDPSARKRDCDCNCGRPGVTGSW
jgi:hypothetical protein